MTESNAGQRSIDQIYRDWRNTLKHPDDSPFWYHPSLARIVLGLAMYAIAVRPILSKLGKAESLKIFNIYINEMVTAWIDDDASSFEFPFETLMKLSQALPLIFESYSTKYPKHKKYIDYLSYTYIYWVPIGGDIDDDLAETILDDITTDGKAIDSDIIRSMAIQIQPIVQREGFDMSPLRAMQLFKEEMAKSIANR